MTAPRLTDDVRLEAMSELRSELAEFSFDGLLQLRDDLARRTVLRGSWAGCVISYRSGAAGSCRRDRRGRARNAFTVMWDNGWLPDADVLGAVNAEITLRNVSLAPLGTAESTPSDREITPARTAHAS